MKTLIMRSFGESEMDRNGEICVFPGIVPGIWYGLDLRGPAWIKESDLRSGIMHSPEVCATLPNVCAFEVAA
jgi:hypothetical protein